MSYAQRREIGTNRMLAIVIVAIVHVLLGYVIVTGLTYRVLKQAADKLTIIEIEEPPPAPPPAPDEPPPAPPEQVAEIPPPIVSPPPIVRLKVAPPPVLQTVKVAPPPAITPRAAPAPPAPAAQPAPPRPAPPPPAVRTVPPVSATGDLQHLFRNDDYSWTAIANEEQGAVAVSLTVGIDGRVSKCNVTSPSGSRTLDRTTCQILRSRARFSPARDDRGNPTTDTVTTRIRWVLEG